MPLDAGSIKWDAPHPAEVVWDNEPKPEAPALAGADRATEDLTNVGSGLTSGVAAIPRAERSLEDKLIEKGSGMMPQTYLAHSLEDLARDHIPGVKALEDKITGFADRPSKTPEGRYIKSVSEQIPTSLVAPGALPYKLAGALGSGVVGQGAADLTNNNPTARALGTLAGGVGSSFAAGKLVPGLSTARTLTEAEKSDQNLIDSGYKLLPSQARPTQLNKLLEGIGGKYRTGQEMSVPNQENTDKLIREELHLAPDTPLTKQTLENIRAQAGDAYEDIKKIPQPFRTDTQFRQEVKAFGDDAAAINKEFGTAKKPAIDDSLIKEIQEQLNKPEFSPRALMDRVKGLRAEASTLSQKYGDVEAQAERALKIDAANALEGLIERNLQALQYPGDLLTKFRAARQLIAKTHDIEETLSPNFNAEEKKMFQIGQKKNLTGNLATVAEMGGRYPKATQDVSSFGGTPSVNAVDMSGMLASRKPEAAGLPLVSGLVRALQRSGPYQRQFVRPTGTETIPDAGLLPRSLANPSLLNLLNQDSDNGQ